MCKIDIHSLIQQRLSFIPVPTIPLTLTATGGDLTNTSEGGSRFILSVSYGYNFLPRNY